MLGAVLVVVAIGAPVPADAVPADPPPRAEPSGPAPSPGVPTKTPAEADPKPAPAAAEADAPDDYEHAPTGAPWRWRRRGLMLAASIAVTHCLQRGCRAEGHLEDIRMRPGPLFRLELGYRPLEWLAVLVTGNVAIHPMKNAPNSDRVDAEPSGISWSVGPSAYAFFVRRGALDPYVNLFVGYWQYRTRLEETSDSTRWATVNVYDRAVARVGLGLNVHVSRSTTVGFRLDQNVPFAGNHCHARQPVPTSAFRDYAECTSIADADVAFTAGLPYFWELGVHVVETFDPQQIKRRILQGRRRRRPR